MIQKTLLVLACGIILAINSCGDSGVNPKKIEPGRRDYEWTVDTLETFNPIYRLWGSSATDVWATTTDLLYHFDGKKWAKSKNPIPYSIYSIYGFAPNEVYIGAQNRIYRFDGINWQETAALTKDGHDWDIVFNNIWGESKDDIYAFGAYSDKDGLANKSVIAHFSNNQWTMLDANPLIGIIARLFKTKSDNRIYLQVIKYSNTYDSTFIYEYKQETFIKLYVTMWDKYWANISIINNEVYFILGSEIARRVNDKFQTVLKLSGTNFYNHIWGRNSKDIFLEMTDGLAHYNGMDIQYLFHFNKQPRTQIGDASLFSQEVFFLVYEGTTRLSLIYHGKLK